MKKLKKLIREQKKFLQDKKLNPSNYLLEKSTTKEYVFYDIKKDLKREQATATRERLEDMCSWRDKT
ncbi:DUF6906 family protein [Clostridium cuniculi]|uniref:DUF6906 family protein n=1 Tax=Clostridium cuniculi TaxID=2548455 RepID=UPI001056CF6E|nr:hypothetical protein [Clostridium cuniculi]